TCPDLPDQKRQSRRNTTLSSRTPAESPSPVYNLWDVELLQVRLGLRTNADLAEGPSGAPSLPHPRIALDLRMHYIIEASVCLPDPSPRCGARSQNENESGLAS